MAHKRPRKELVKKKHALHLRFHGFVLEPGGQVLVAKEEHVVGLNRVLAAPGAPDDPLVVERHFQELPETKLPGVC